MSSCLQKCITRNRQASGMQYNIDVNLAGLVKGVALVFVYLLYFFNTNSDYLLFEGCLYINSLLSYLGYIPIN